ncbi:uncharacterized protein GGS22DRAFT_9363 [Annulohypoxylon maeteangense]|uniref:uncharacterized protein n=1 Tax=Annulohypoxylon maeteangense TaxID=1927788 RepID=UPI002008A63D|nr:uncharacterized protein GGS22DRAFT_9363 [Annulohypoxylon maeteangense]KAI0890197.1 hypothetical protein GGS22DRAFT_9363 [Annulohypoxylon maeteangense]
MGNCLSTLRGFFKGRRVSAPDEEGVPLGDMQPGTNKENEQNPHVSSTGGDVTAFPTGSIELPAGDDHNSSVSVQSTAVNSSHSRGGENSAQADAPGGATTHHADADVQSHGSGDSMNDAAAENAQIQVARRTSILRVGPARIVSARSAGNIRSVTFSLPDSPRTPGLKHSATMSEINSNNDPVANYIKKNAETIHAAKQRWEQFDLNRHRQVQHAQYRENLKNMKNPGDLYMVPYFDEGDLDANGSGMLGMGIPTHARVPSKVYTQQIRDLSGQSLRPVSIPSSYSFCHTLSYVMPPASGIERCHVLNRIEVCLLTIARQASPRHPRQVRSMNHLRVDPSVSSVSSGSVRSGMVSPLTPQSGYPRRGVSDPSTPLAGPNNMEYQSDINARRGLARLQELTPAKRLCVVKERHPQTTNESRVPLLDREGKPSQDISEADEQGKTEEKAADKTSDDELMTKALEQVGQALMKARARILNKVRKHVEDEVHAAYITEAILGLDDDIVEECAHADNADSQHLIRTQVAKIRRVSDAEMRIERVTDADLEYCAESTKKQKAAALVEKWKAEALAEVEAKQKGKGKAVDTGKEKGVRFGGGDATF